MIRSSLYGRQAPGSVSHATRDNIDRVIAACAQTGDHRLIPLWRAVRDHGVVMVMATPTAPVADIPRRLRHRPLILLVIDDIDGAMGPAGFDSPTLRRIVRGAGAVIVCSPIPPDSWYERAAAATANGRNAVIIDTTARHEVDWLKFLEPLLGNRVDLMVAVDRNGVLGLRHAGTG